MNRRGTVTERAYVGAHGVVILARTPEHARRIAARARKRALREYSAWLAGTRGRYAPACTRIWL